MASQENANGGVLNQELNLERIVFFSDAVMAIVITLLAVDLKMPEVAGGLAADELPKLLSEMLPQFISFGLSFAVIGIFWLAHHHSFGYIKRYDGMLIWLNFLFLLCIAFLPFTNNLLGRYPQLHMSNVIYTLNLTGGGLAASAVWMYASRNHRLVDKDLDPRVISSGSIRLLSAPVVFLLSMPVVFINITLAHMMWWMAAVVSAVIVWQAHRLGLA